MKCYETYLSGGKSTEEFDCQLYKFIGLEFWAGSSFLRVQNWKHKNNEIQYMGDREWRRWNKGENGREREREREIIISFTNPKTEDKYRTQYLAKYGIVKGYFM